MKISEITDPFAQNAHAAIRALLIIQDIETSLSTTVGDVIERCKLKPTGVNQDLARELIRQDDELTELILASLSQFHDSVPGIEELKAKLITRRSELASIRNNLNLE